MHRRRPRAVWTDGARDAFVRACVERPVTPSCDGARKARHTQRGMTCRYVLHRPVACEAAGGAAALRPYQAAVAAAMAPAVAGYFAVLRARLRKDPDIRAPDVRVYVRGSTALALHGVLPDGDDAGARDLDISVLIDPSLGEADFDRTSRTVRRHLFQTLSRLKRILDDAYFRAATPAPNRPQRSAAAREADRLWAELRPSEEAVTATRAALRQGLAAVAAAAPGTTATSVLDGEQDAVRLAARRSSLIRVHASEPDVLCMVDVPHFPCSELIPLRRTPLYCTHNDSIRFARNDAGLVASFELFRLKLRGAVVRRDDDDGGAFERPEVAGTSLIDVVVYRREDDELRVAWARGSQAVVPIGAFDVLSLEGVLSDLAMIRDVYDVTPERRQRALELLGGIGGHAPHPHL